MTAKPTPAASAAKPADTDATDTPAKPGGSTPDASDALDAVAAEQARRLAAAREAQEARRAAALAAQEARRVKAAQEAEERAREAEAAAAASPAPDAAPDPAADAAQAPGRGAEEAEEQGLAGKALLEERKRIFDRMNELKNEKLRRQLEQMEAEDRAEEEAQDAARLDAAEGPSKDAPRPAPELTGPPAVRGARLRLRHVFGLLVGLAMLFGPVVGSAWYLWTRAHDRYISYAGFSVRTEEVGSAFELLGGVAELSGSSSSDTDILYKFIQSPELVARADAALDLRSLWGRPGTDWTNPGHDPVYAYNPGGALAGLLRLVAREAGQDRAADAVLGGAGPDRGTIEDLTAHWRRMVKVYSDSGTGLIDLEVQAFAPEEARAIAQLIYDESSAMINRLSAIARENAIGYAREERDQAVQKLAEAREALTRFRLRSGIVDPSVTIQEQLGLLTPLQAQLAQTLIDLEVQRQTTREGDPRLVQLENRVKVIEAQIAQERRNQGLDAAEGAAQDEDTAFAVNLAEYERLSVDLEFAQQSYTAALAAYDAALAEAQRQSRYLAAHVNPTLPESAALPARGTVLSLVALFSFLAWATTILALYALRDRR